MIRFLIKDGISSWCRGRDCVYHPGRWKYFFNIFYNFKRCILCKRIVQKDFFKDKK